MPGSGGGDFGSGREYVCSNCNYREVYERDVLCNNRKCPGCDALMTQPF